MVSSTPTGQGNVVFAFLSEAQLPSGGGTPTPPPTASPPPPPVPVEPPPPVGGGSRGVEAYTLLTPTTTVASPYTITQVNAARDAAGANGIVRFPQAGSPYNMSPTMGINGQTWQMETTNTTINGTVEITASDVTFEGGIARSHTGRTPPHASNVTIRNVKAQGSGGFADSDV